VLASNVECPISLAVDAVNVYWGTTGCGPGGYGQIQSVPIGGGTPKTLAQGLSIPTGLAVDATRVYFTDTQELVVGSVPLGGASTWTALAVTMGDTPGELALGQGALYWLNWGWKLPNDASIVSVAVGGGTPKAVIAPGSWLGGPIATTTTLYWADDTGNLQSMPLGGGPVTALGVVIGLYGVSPFAVGPTAVAWIGLEGLKARPLAGGPVTAIWGDGTLGCGPESGLCIVVDEADVYWTGYPSGGCYGAVFKAPVGGGSVTTIAADQDGPTAIVADGTAVYWITANMGAVWKVAK
jgi:uncharacterized repeat protein (TIGR03803 family)